MKQLLFAFFSFCILSSYAQSIDSAHAGYSGQILSTYIKGLLADPDWSNRPGTSSNLAITSIHYQQSNDTVRMDVFFLPCGGAIQIIPYDTLVEKSLPLNAGLKTLLIYARDTVKPGCSKSDRYVDTAMLSFNVPISIEEHALNTQIKLYPNPGRGLFTLETAKGIEVKQLSVKSLSGKAVGVFARQEEVLDLRHLPKGVYLVEVHTEQGIAVKKLVLE